MNEQPSALSAAEREQERRERRNFLRWNAVVILLVLAGGYEMVMGRMLWKQLEPIQSALAKVGVQMNVTYKQMRGSTIEFEDSLFKVKIKLSHQVWTLLSGDFYRGSVQGEIKLDPLKQSINGKVALDWDKTAHVQLKSSGAKHQILQSEPTELALTLPTQEPKRFVLEIKHGKMNFGGGEVAAFDAIVKAEKVFVPQYHHTINGKTLKVDYLNWSPETNVLTIREGQMGDIAFKALTVAPKVVDGEWLNTDVQAQLMSVDGAPPMHMLLQQKLSFFERNMAKNPIMAWGLIGKNAMAMQIEMPSEAAFQSALDKWGVQAWQTYFVEHNGTYHTIAIFNPEEQTFSLKHPQ